MASVRMIVPREWYVWARGFSVLPVEATAVGEARFRGATKALYDESQKVVHVITGELKRSGRYEVSVSGLEVTGQVVYGNEGIVDYAAAEHDRGGTHAYLDRAWETMDSRFDDAIGTVWEDVVHSWR